MHMDVHVLVPVNVKCPRPLLSILYPHWIQDCTILSTLTTKLALESDDTTAGCHTWLVFWMWVLRIRTLVLTLYSTCFISWAISSAVNTYLACVSLLDLTWDTIRKCLPAQALHCEYVWIWVPPLLIREPQVVSKPPILSICKNGSLDIISFQGLLGNLNESVHEKPLVTALAQNSHLIDADCFLLLIIKTFIFGGWHNTWKYKKILPCI